MKMFRRRLGAILLSAVGPLTGCSESTDLLQAGPDAAGGAAGASDVMVAVDATVRFDTSVGVDENGSADTVGDGHPTERQVDIASGARDATTEEGGTCESRCASGVCDANGDCRRCVKDEECTGGRVCGSGVCAPRCSFTAPCTGSFVCCNEHCVDTTLDPKHCGACGAACPATQFCATAAAPSACKSNILANVCNAKNATFLLDGLQADQEATVVLHSALTTRCSPPPIARTVSQSVATVINPTTGQPVAGGGELLVAVGGDSAQRLVNYLEDSGTSRVFNEYDGLNTLWFKRRDAGNAILATITRTTLTPTHDYFLVEVVFDPISGTFCLVIYGVDSPGTKAGVYYFANTMLPSLATYTQGWYLYEWMGVDADGGPGPGDTFTLLASGL